MTQKKFKVGLLGAGYILDAHAKALKFDPRVEIVAVCDRAIERARRAATTYGAPNVFADLDDMLASDVDVVHVLLPPALHVDATRQILASGRHAFVEKPMGLNAAQCQELADFAKQKNVRLAVNHNFLFLETYVTLRQHARDGTLGNLDQITINWLYPLGLVKSGPFGNWILREPQNLFFELGPHLTAFMVDLIGVPDRIHTDAFHPIDLPGGGRVYRHWHVHALKGNTAIDLNLSVTPGQADRSIVVRAHAASARCDFERDAYVLDEPSGAGLLFDSFYSMKNVSRQLRNSAWKNVKKALINTLQKKPAANPFGDSIARSIVAFYTTLDGEIDSRLDPQFGVKVITACEQIVASAHLEPPPVQVNDVQPPLRKPNVLVLGGTGFIGKYLVKRLIDDGHGVRVVARDQASAKIAFAGMPVELVAGDIAEQDLMDAALQGTDTVFHLAKAVGKRWADYERDDVAVTQMIARRAQEQGVKRFIYTGTIDSYYSGNANDVITGDTPLDIKMATRNHYARSKATCEALLLKMQREENFPVVILRPGVVIGLGCPPAHWGVGMFQSDTCVQFWGDGASKLPLVLVEDVADALLRAMIVPGIEGKCFLLTDKPLLSAAEYVDVVSAASGTRLRATSTPIWRYYLIDLFKETLKHLVRHPNRRAASYRDWDSKSHRARYDSTSTQQALGWHPAGSREALIERGINAAVADYLR